MSEYKKSLINKYVEGGKIDSAINILLEQLVGDLKQVEIYLKLSELYLIKEQYNLAYLLLENALNYAKQNEQKQIYQSLEDMKCKYKVDVKPYSIVILTYNNLEYTKKCIESIRKNNILDNYEIIIVDNASTDGTREWIKRTQGIKYILNDKNVGFPKGCNQGIELANVENDIFLLNNDTLIMANSIFNLRFGLYSDMQIGAVGAVSNRVSYGQQIKEEYDSLRQYEIYAMKNNIPRIQDHEMRLKLVGFAMLIKREVLNQVGYLDEQFTPGNYEDDDLSIRIIKVGYKNVLCKNSFIYHYGSVSFKKEQNRYIKLLNVNKEKFKMKWGFDANYSLMVRNDVIGHINEDVCKPIKVLEVGCACGATLLAIKSKYKNAELFGMEINEQASKIARHIADVRAGDIEKDEMPFEKEMFDYIIFADVLEHLRDPESVLEKMRRYLKNDGRIIASMPNVRHISVVTDLLKGKWTYEDSGILDVTHLRFFTLSEIDVLFKRAGYEIDDIKASMVMLNDENEKMINSLERIAPGRKDEYRCYQYILSAKKIDISDTLSIKKICKLLDYIEVNNDDNQSIEKLLKELDEMNDIELLIKGIHITGIDKVKLFNLIGIECYRNKRYDDVIPLLQEALKLKPHDFDAIYNLATILAIMGEVELANYYIDQLNEEDSVKEQIRKEIIV